MDFDYSNFDTIKESNQYKTSSHLKAFELT